MPNENRNRVMVLTPRAPGGGSAIAVVRVRGPGVGEFLGRFFSKSTVSGRCVHAELRDGKSIIDDAVVVSDPSGNWADICLHGGAWVVESTLLLAQREGFQIVGAALPVAPEAFDECEGEIDREMMQYLPLALTEPVMRMLLNQPAVWREAAKQNLDRAAVVRDLTLWRLLHPPTIAIVGRPNVGKSTLANRLFGQQRSITADLPGTTRDWVGELADIAGMPALLIDTPGERETGDPIEGGAIAAGRGKIRKADLLIAVLDATSEDSARENPGNVIVVVNKTDAPARWDFSGSNALLISARTGRGCDELCREIQRRLGVEDVADDRARWWTERQKKILLEPDKDSGFVAKIIGE